MYADRAVEQYLCLCSYRSSVIQFEKCYSPVVEGSPLTIALELTNPDGVRHLMRAATRRN
jgi:hypothetical protein